MIYVEYLIVGIMDGDIIVSTTDDVDVERPCEESLRDESCLIFFLIVGTGFNVLIESPPIIIFTFLQFTQLFNDASNYVHFHFVCKF